MSGFNPVTPSLKMKKKKMKWVPKALLKEQKERKSEDRLPIEALPRPLPSIYGRLIELLQCTDEVESEKLEKLKQLLQRPLSQSDLNSFLLECVEYGSGAALLELILNKGVDQSALDAALKMQLERESLEGVLLLLRYKANPNCIIQQPSEHSSFSYTLSPLQKVIREFSQNERRLPVVQSLLRHRADPNWREQTLRRKVSPKARMRDSMEEAMGSVRELLSRVSPAFDQEGGGMRLGRFRGEVQRRSSEPVKEYRSLKTALHYACEEGEVEEVKVLLEAKADPNLQDAEGDSALHKVMVGGEDLAPSHLKIMSYLLEHKASSHLQNKEKDTPLHLLMRKHFSSRCDDPSVSGEMIKTLVEAKADIRLTNRHGNTLLHEIMLAMKEGLAYWKRAASSWPCSLPELLELPAQAEKKAMNPGQPRPPVTSHYVARGLQQMMEERIHLAALTALDALPSEAILACMRMQNKQAVTPAHFFDTFRFPARLFRGVPDFGSRGKKGGGSARAKQSGGVINKVS